MREEGENPPETRWHGRCATRLVWPTLTLQVRLSKADARRLSGTYARAVVARRTSVSCAREWLVVPCACACSCWSPPFSPPHQTRSGIALASSAHICFHNVGVKALETRREASGSAFQNNTLLKALQIHSVEFCHSFFTPKPILLSYSTLEAKLYISEIQKIWYTRKKTADCSSYIIMFKHIHFMRIGNIELFNLRL